MKKATYNAAIISAIKASNPHWRVLVRLSFRAIQMSRTTKGITKMARNIKLGVSIVLYYMMQKSTKKS